MSRHTETVRSPLRELEREYELVRELGRGGMAVVYLARERGSGEDVAVKVIHAKHVDDAETVARFEREASTVAELQHPNIVQLHGVRRLGDGSIALVMQYVAGRTLKEAIRQERGLDFERVEHVLHDIAEALGHAHRRGIVHRDVKPENIYLDETTGGALLSDFGIARSVGTETNLTLTGTAIGTPAYMSPEQIDGRDIDGRSDLYSLALVGWEMVTGEQPWANESLYSIIYKQKREELSPLDGVRPDVPARLQHAIEGALRKEPAARWQSAEEFSIELLYGQPPPSGSRSRLRKLVPKAFRPLFGAGPSGPTEESDTVVFRRAGAAPPELRGDRRQMRLAALLVLPLIAIGAASLARRGDQTEAVQPPASDSLATRLDSTLLAASTGAPAATDEGRSRASEVVAAGSAAGTVVQMPRSAAPARYDEPVVNAPQSPIIGPARDVAARELPVVGTGDAASSRARSGTAPAVAPRPSNAAVTGSSPVPPMPRPAPEPGSAEFRGDHPVRAVNPPPEISARMVTGGTHSCSLTGGGVAYCWGGNERGQAGAGTAGRVVAATRVAGDLRFSMLAGGIGHSCGISRDGAAYCWGANDRGQLGDGTLASQSSPSRVIGDRPLRIVRTGMSHSCALASDGEVYCWGGNASGQLGDASRSGRAAPVRVASEVRFAALASGWNHSCALTAQGAAHCWGQNFSGQLGQGSQNDRTVPTAVAGGLAFTDIAAGSAHSCAITTAGDAYCWGRNTNGQLGDGGTTDRSRPVRVQTTRGFVAIVAGSVHSCGLTRGGETLCWGRNSYGQLGDGSTEDRALPVVVDGAPQFAALHATGAHSCGTTASGTSYCWGYNINGQLGDGTRTHRAKPVVARKPTS